MNALTAIGNLSMRMESAGWPLLGTFLGNLFPAPGVNDVITAYLYVDGGAFSYATGNIGGGAGSQFTVNWPLTNVMTAGSHLITVRLYSKTNGYTLAAGQNVVYLKELIQPWQNNGTS